MSVYKRFRVFGWIVVQCQLEAGDKPQLEIPVATDIREFDNITMYSAGKVSMSYSDGNPNGYRTMLLPGDCPVLDAMTTTKNPVVPAQTLITFEALEPSEYWCFNYLLNRRSLPVLERVIMSEEDTMTVTNKKLFLMNGTMTIGDTQYMGPISIDIANESVINAVTDCFGVFVAEERQVS